MIRGIRDDDGAYGADRHPGAADAGLIFDSRRRRSSVGIEERGARDRSSPVTFRTTTGTRQARCRMAGALLCVLAGTASAAPLPDLEVTPRLGATLPLDARFVDENGAAVRLGDLVERRPAVLVFEYLSCPNLCGVVLGDLAAAVAGQKLRPGRDFEVVAIGIDPRDMPGDAIAAKARLGVGEGWHVLTGAGAAARAVADAAGFPYAWDGELGQFVHPAAAIVLAPGGRVSRYLLGAGYDAGELGAAVADAPAAAQDGVSGRRLLCFGGGAIEAGLAAVAQNAVRVVALGTLGALAALMMWAGRRRNGI
jgi:protein SCO1/2